MTQEDATGHFIHTANVASLALMLLVTACSGSPGEPTPVADLTASSASPSPGGLLPSTAVGAGHGSVPCPPPGPVHGGPSPGRWIGSEVATDYGGAAIYPKAQSFFARAGTIRRVDVHLQNPATSSWRLRVVTALPRESSTTPGRMNSADLQSKTLGLVRVPRSPAGWVSLEFCPAVSVRSGQRYYVYMDAVAESVFGGTGSNFTNGNWSSSSGGPHPGPYAGGTGWIYVWSTRFWGDNSNVRTDVAMRHRDYAFRVYLD